MNCIHCGKPTSTAIDEDGEQFPTCLSCFQSLKQIEAMDFARTAAAFNLTAALCDQMTGGIAGRTPQIQIPTIAAPRVGAMNVNNIRVENSNIGVINTGTIRTIEQAVGKLDQAGTSDLANRIRELSAAIQVSKDINVEDRNSLAELLSVVSEEAAKPKVEQRTTIVRNSLRDFAAIVGSASGLSNLWATHGPALIEYFEITL